MRTPPITALMFLIGRWLRSAGLRRSSVMLSLTFTLLAAVFVSVSAFTLSASQEAEKEFGSYQQQVFAPVYVGELDDGFVARARSALTSRLPDAHLMIVSTQVRPDSFAKRYVQAPLENLRYVEDPGLREAFPGRYTLEEGSWPGKPFEVVVTRALRAALPDPDEFTVLSGRATFTVVGVVRDAYAERADTIVAGPGTWESIPRPAAGREYQPVGGEVAVLFDRATPAADVAGVLLDLLPREADASSRDIGASLSTRAEFLRLPVAEFGSSGQLVVSYVPLLLVVLVVSALVVGQRRGPHRANADRLVAVGISRRLAQGSQVLALSVAAAVSIAAGLGIGWLVGIALRTSVLPVVADQPLSPLPVLDATAAAIAASALVLIVAGTLWPERSTGSARRRVVSRWLADIQIGLIRRVAVVLLVLGAVQVRAGGVSVVDSYLAMAGVLLAAPDVLRILVWALPSGNPRTFVTRRLIQADLGRQAAAVVVVGCCLALPISAATQLVSKKLSDASFTFSRVPLNQVWVQSTGGTGDVTGVAQVVSRVPQIGQPVAVRGSSYSPDPNAKNSAAAFFTEVPKGNSSSALMVIDSADQVREVVGDDITPNAESVLDAGGVLDFSGAEGDQRFIVYSAKGKELLRTPVLPTLKVSLPKQISSQFGGAVLRSTAQGLGLPVDRTPNKFIFTDVPTPVIGDAVQAVVNAGYDSEFVQYATPPPPPTLPIYAYVYLAGLVLGGFTVLLVAIRGQAKRLRSYSARLVALGLGPRWTLSILGIHATTILAVGLIAGYAAAALGVELTTDNYVVTDVPTLPVTLACLGTLTAAGLATALAVRTLTASEHREVN